MSPTPKKPTRSETGRTTRKAPARPAKAAAKSPATSKSTVKKKAAEPRAVRPDDMSADVIEFIQAVDRYKRVHDRKFPNLSELLQIVKELGYTK